MVNSDVKYEYDKFAPYYELVANKRSHFEKQVKLIKSIVNEVGSIENVLDASCATGNVICDLKLEFPNLQASGSDICKSFISIAKTKDCSVSFVVCDWKSIAKVFQNKKFNLIYILGNSISHCDSIKELGNIFYQVNSILSLGGFFVLDLRDWAKNAKKNDYNGEDLPLRFILDDKLFYETKYYKSSRHHLKHYIFSENQLITEISLHFLKLKQSDIESIAKKYGFSVENNFIENIDYPFKYYLLKKCN